MAKYTHELFMKNTKAHEGCKNKKMTTVQNFLVKGWSIESCITKVIEWIVHKTKGISSLVTIKLLSR